MKQMRLIVDIERVRHPAQKVDNVFRYHFWCGHSFVGNLQYWRGDKLRQPLTGLCQQCEGVEVNPT